MRTVLISLGLFGLACVVWAQTGEERATKAPTSEPTREVGGLEQFGPQHPRVLAAKIQLSEQATPPFKGPALVLTRNSGDATTLQDLRIMPLGTRHFLVGTEINSDYTRGSFVGKRLWIPIEEVTKLVELGDSKPEAK